MNVGGTGFQPVVSGILPETGEAHPPVKSADVGVRVRHFGIWLEAKFNRLEAGSTGRAELASSIRCRRLTLRSATEFSQRENFHHE